MLRPPNMQKSFVWLSLLALSTTIGVALPAQAATLTIGVNNVVNPLVDDGIATGVGTFGLAPASATVASGTFVTRTTTPVNGQSISYAFTHVNFPVSDPIDFATDTQNKSAFRIENPVGQNAATATTWGADSNAGGNGLNAILFDFSASNVPVRQFGVTLLDFEGGDQGLGVSNAAGIPARVVAYDSNGTIVFNQQFTNPSGVFGKNGVLPITFSSDANDAAISRLLFAVGDDNFDGLGTRQRWAFAAPTFNSLSAESVPTPALLPGLVAIIAGARRRWKVAD
jgi:hypothetical protein